MVPRAADAEPIAASEPMAAAVPIAADAPPTAMHTPMMQQYLEAKAECPEALLLFRMGDFYELFLDDAVEAARILELTLTARNKKDDQPIPMAGVPYHALPTYLPRLLQAGKKVAICEQVEDPKVAKGLVKRAVVRIVTPGVVLDETILEGREPHWLAAIDASGESEGEVAVAWLDVSTGERKVLVVRDEAAAVAELERLEVKEVLVDREAHADALAAAIGKALGAVPLARRAAVGARASERAAELVAAYAAEMHRGAPLALQPLEVVAAGATMELPPTTVRNLELLRTIIDGGRKGSLLGLIDVAATSLGSRLLKEWLLSPLYDLAAIAERHDGVAAALEHAVIAREVRSYLKDVADLERLVARIAAKSATPRDLVQLGTSLGRVPGIAKALADSEHPALAALAAGLDPVEEARAEIERAIVDEPPATLKDGGVLRAGFDPELDRLSHIAREGKDWFVRYGDALREQSGIQSLKVKYNSVFGYFIEITRANLERVPASWLRKQTLANAERYYTPELKAREDEVLGADDKRLALEAVLFEALRAALHELGPRIQATARRLATIDALMALAEVAERRGWTRPLMVAEPTLAITAGRHPVVEAMLPTGTFVPNDLTLDERGRLVILTGPNMAGKSTVMRQTALIAILAQMGSYVPAQSATLGLVDRIFTRVGASDDLARGQSTFMVEMTETAQILARATPQSLVILDEIGRGTATWDGLSIAWAVAECLADQLKPRALFATHYHELTSLADTREGVVNLSIAVREWQDDVVFLRRLVPGGASKSYGIQVARLAGLPPGVLARAREILGNLEAMSVDPDSRPRIARGGKRPAHWQLSLFAGGAPAVEATPGTPAADGLPGTTDAAPAPDPVREALAAVDVDDLTPRAALDLVYRLRDLARVRGAKRPSKPPARE